MSFYKYQQKSVIIPEINVFIMQSLLMTVSIYTHLTMVSIGKFEAMLEENITANFFYIFILKITLS